MSGAAAADDTQRIEGCLATAEAKTDCIGVIAGDCEGIGGTTRSMAACYDREAAGWDRLLNTWWPRMRALAHAADASNRGQFGADFRSAAEAQLAAQQAWIAFRDAECDHRYLLSAGGSIRVIVGAICRLDVTARRVIDFVDTLAIHDWEGARR